jgi:hypothetical protein
MKKYQTILSSIKAILFFAVITTLMNCTKLQLEPQGQLSVESTLSDYNGFKTYAWQFYNAFSGYTNAMLDKDVNSDLFLYANSNSQSTWIWQRMTVPSSSSSYSQSYAYIRQINQMLDYIEKSPLNDAGRSHWRSVGYFFRAYNYANLVNLYGDVPYIDHALTDADPQLYIARTPRDSVAMHILNDLQYAEANIKTGDGDNTINVNVVRALISRFGLMEGTWRKYHSLPGANTYLQASADASVKLVAALPALAPNYDLVFNSESLAGVPGIILYKSYVLNQVTHGLSTQNRNSSGRYDLTKAAADLFLMTDGKNRFTSPLFQGDTDPFSEFRNRDRRLYFSVSPPFKVNTTPPSLVFTYTSNPNDTSYFALMKSISDSSHKALPTRNWNGFVLRQEPHYVDFNNGQPYNVTYTGYRFDKYYNLLVQNAQGSDISDCPLFRMGEVLVNYAEAQYELGGFNQGIADATINKLRARGGVQPLNVATISNDPSRDPDVDAVLWEIRRERAVELIGEGFRFDDLRRWNKMSYAVKEKLGRWIVKGVDVPVNSNIPIKGGASQGYISYWGVPPGPYPDYYYLYPIPSNEIILNPKIIQNPGWK